MNLEELESHFDLRPYTAEDIPFIHNSWGTSYYRCSGANKAVTSGQFHDRHRPLREAFFSRPQSAVIVCCDKSDPWLIVGWVALEQTDSGIVLHYISIKSAFKRMGIARWMLSKLKGIIAYTHRTKDLNKVRIEKPEYLSQLIYIPHLI